MSFTENAWKIFNQSVEDYHIKDDVNSQENNPFQTGSLEWILYSKNWIDTVQWHLEDIIREEDIDPTEALKIKRRIDALKEQILWNRLIFGFMRNIRILLRIQTQELTQKRRPGL